MDAYALKIHQKNCAKTAHFFNQSEFRKKSSAFGEEIIQGSLLSPWRYAGKRYDKKTGYIYFGERYYDPQTICWLTPDPLGDFDGSNLYQFVHNNPLYYIDPDGRADFLAFAIPLAWTAVETIIASFT